MKARVYAGRIPPADAGWTKVEDLKSADGTRWSLYRQPQPHSSDWSTYKVVAIPEAERKANYWFVFNEETRKIGFSRDLVVMSKSRPELHAELIGYLTR